MGYTVITDGKAGKDVKPVELAYSFDGRRRSDARTALDAVRRPWAAYSTSRPARRRRSPLCDHAAELRGGEYGPIAPARHIQSS